MSNFDVTYAEASANAAHYKALGNTQVYLHGDDIPWDKVTRIEDGCGYRMSGPTGCYIVVEESGLTYKWSLDFEPHSANGATTALFDRPRLREAAMRMPPHVRSEFGAFLSDKVLPPLQERRREFQAYLNKQADSEDCVRGLIAYCNEAGT